MPIENLSKRNVVLKEIRQIDLRKGYVSNGIKDGILNVLGISTTASYSPDKDNPNPTDALLKRRSTSEHELDNALEIAKHPTGANAQSIKGCNTYMLKLREIDFKECEGYYSDTKEKCNWPCLITDMDYGKPEAERTDHMDLIYKALLWADIILVATPIRFGNASSLYYKMVERLNSIHNEMTLRGHHVIKDKVAGFIITGGQDGIQQVAGQMLTFWSELGYVFSRYSYVGWSRGWYAENTVNNFGALTRNKTFDLDLRKMVEFAIDLKIRLDKSPSTLIEQYEYPDDYKSDDPDMAPKPQLT